MKAAKRMTVRNIPLVKLKISNVQPRQVFKEENLQELAVSIQKYGILQPLIVKKILEKYEIIAGERRFRAAQICQLKSVPCVVMGLSLESSFAIALVENLQRENLNPIEEALAYKRLSATLDYSQQEIASLVGKDRASIANALRLLKLPQNIQVMVINSELSMGQARALLGLEKSDLMEMVAKKVAREGLSVRKTESLIRALNKGLGQIERKNIQNADQKNKFILELERNIAERLGTKVSIKKIDQGFLVEAHYAGARELDNLLILLGIEL